MALEPGYPASASTKGSRNDMEKKLTKYTAHDFVWIFANDINTYLEKGGSIDNLSATNVFNVINDESDEDRFAFTKNVLMSALNFRTESLTISYIYTNINKNTVKWPNIQLMLLIVFNLIIAYTLKFNTYDKKKKIIKNYSLPL